MTKTFHCSIVTPTAAAFDGDVSYATFPSWDGQYGMLPGMAPLLTKLAAGSLRLDDEDGGRRWFLIEGGFAHVEDGGLSLVTEGARRGEDIDLAEAQAALAEADARVADDGTERSTIEHDRQVARAAVAVARSAAGQGTS